MPPSITAIVLSYNSVKYLEKCIKSIVFSFREIGATGKTIVVDNGSTDGSTQLLAELKVGFEEHLEVIYLPKNTGTTVSRNIPLRKCCSDYVLVIDSDALCNPVALQSLIDELVSHPECAIVGPQLRYPDGRFQLSFDVFPTFQRKVSRLIGLRRIESLTLIPSEPCEVDYLISAFWLIPTAALKKVGNLDENIFYSPEDVDFCIRAWKAGFTVRYVPGVSAIHDSQELSRGKALNRFFARHASGLLYYFRKHEYIFKAPNFKRPPLTAESPRPDRYLNP